MPQPTISSTLTITCNNHAWLPPPPETQRQKHNTKTTRFFLIFLPRDKSFPTFFPKGFIVCTLPTEFICSAVTCSKTWSSLRETQEIQSWARLVWLWGVAKESLLHHPKGPKPNRNYKHRKIIENSVVEGILWNLLQLNIKIHVRDW